MKKKLSSSGLERGAFQWLPVMMILILLGCAGISQEQAEKAAASFLSERVKFVANSTEIGSYTVGAVSSYREGGDWIVMLHVESEVNGTVKKNDVAIGVNSGGKITSLNGRKVV